MSTSSQIAASLVVRFLAPLPPDQEQALVDACSLALESGDCFSEGTKSPEAGNIAEPALRAVVDASGGTRILLEVSDTRDKKQRFASREINFLPQDDENERARAIGLALGVFASLLTERSGDAVPPAEGPSQAEAKETQQEAQPADPLQSAPSRQTSYWLGADVGPAWLPAWGRLGFSADLNGGVLVASRFAVVGRAVAVLISGRDEIPRVSSIAPTIGPAISLESKESLVQFSVEGGVDLLQVRTTPSAAGESSGSRVIPLGRLHLVTGFRLNSNIWLTVAPSVDVLLSNTSIVVDETEIGRTGTLRPALRIGLLWNKPREPELL